MSGAPGTILGARSAAAPHRAFLRAHLLWPALLFGLAALLLAWSGLDFRLADVLYRLEGGRWALHDHYLTRALLHDGAKEVGRAVVIGLLCVALISVWHPRLRAWRRPLWYPAVAIPMAVALAGWLWGLCPWDMARYGGDQPTGLAYFAALPGQTDSGHCLPAGHAAGGYALLALYFLLRELRPRWALRGLVAGIGLGLVLGFDQQLRGAHFLSHDLCTAAVCWFTSLGMYLLFYPGHALATEPARSLP